MFPIQSNKIILGFTIFFAVMLAISSLAIFGVLFEQASNNDPIWIVVLTVLILSTPFPALYICLSYGKLLKTSHIDINETFS